ncbi:MAG TPA: methionine--tRNA ligase [Gemmatimonadales bacterium]|nr:methionine--tRNA ligase [Gemmatimonadales bacterium]
MSRFYLTTAIDYANGDPHLGHAYEKIGADAIARYHRLAGDDVWFLIGMDEHGQKVAQTAADRGVAPEQLTADVAERFEAMWARLAISHDQFIRTTSGEHKTGVRELIDRIFERNPDDFYEKSYAGWYCVGCESFKQDAEIEDGKCVLHPTRTLEWVEERNWFFRLSRYADFLIALHENDPEFLQPESRRNEILAFLRQGVEDISASRARFNWGVPFPRPTSDGEQQTTYVWFDALPNYWTATRFPGSSAEWPAQLHVIGKDITRFHTVIWPAMLEAAGLELPRQVWAHGFVYFRGERFSKSAGTQLDLNEAIERFGPDAFRYFLLREIPWDADGNFTWERFEERYSADLADGLGNLASRSLAMLAKYRDGVVPEATPSDMLESAGLKAIAAYRERMDELDIRGAADAAWGLVSDANLFIQQSAPWALAKAGDDAALDRILAALASCLARLAVLSSPFLPASAQALWSATGMTGPVTDARLAGLPGLRMGGKRTSKVGVLFPKDAER